MFKVNNKVTKRSHWRYLDVFIVNLEHVSLCFSVFVFDRERVFFC